MRQAAALAPGAGASSSDDDSSDSYDTGTDDDVDTAAFRSERTTARYLSGWTAGSAWGPVLGSRGGAGGIGSTGRAGGPAGPLMHEGSRRDKAVKVWSDLADAVQRIASLGAIERLCKADQDLVSAWLRAAEGASAGPRHEAQPAPAGPTEAAAAAELGLTGATAVIDLACIPLCSIGADGSLITEPAAPKPPPPFKFQFAIPSQPEPNADGAPDTAGAGDGLSAAGALTVTSEADSAAAASASGSAEAPGAGTGAGAASEGRPPAAAPADMAACEQAVLACLDEAYPALLDLGRLASALLDTCLSPASEGASAEGTGPSAQELAAALAACRAQGACGTSGRALAAGAPLLGEPHDAAAVGASGPAAWIADLGQDHDRQSPSKVTCAGRAPPDGANASSAPAHGGAPVANGCLGHPHPEEATANGGLGRPSALGSETGGGTRDARGGEATEAGPGTEPGAGAVCPETLTEREAARLSAEVTHNLWWCLGSVVLHVFRAPHRQLQSSPASWEARRCDLLLGSARRRLRRELLAGAAQQAAGLQAAPGPSGQGGTWEGLRLQAASRLRSTLHVYDLCTALTGRMAFVLRQAPPPSAAPLGEELRAWLRLAAAAVACMVAEQEAAAWAAAAEPLAVAAEGGGGAAQSERAAACRRAALAASAAAASQARALLAPPPHPALLVYLAPKAALWYRQTSKQRYDEAGMGHRREEEQQKLAVAAAAAAGAAPAAVKVAKRAAAHAESRALSFKRAGRAAHRDMIRAMELTGLVSEQAKAYEAELELLSGAGQGPPQSSGAGDVGSEAAASSSSSSFASAAEAEASPAEAQVVECVPGQGVEARGGHGPAHRWWADVLHAFWCEHGWGCAPLTALSSRVLAARAAARAGASQRPAGQGAAGGGGGGGGGGRGGEDEKAARAADIESVMYGFKDTVHLQRLARRPLACLGGLSMSAALQLLVRVDRMVIFTSIAINGPTVNGQLQTEACVLLQPLGRAGHALRMVAPAMPVRELPRDPAAAQPRVAEALERRKAVSFTCERAQEVELLLVVMSRIRDARAAARQREVVLLLHDPKDHEMELVALPEAPLPRLRLIACEAAHVGADGVVELDEAMQQRRGRAGDDSD